jgi:translation elongation factor aEF-1 beta
VNLLDLKEENTMGDVVGLIRIMPTEVLDDNQLKIMMEEIKKYVKSPAKIGSLEIKNVAFGLRAINLTVIIPDSAGGIDPIADEISKMEKVETAEVTDVGLL